MLDGGMPVYIVVITTIGDEDAAVRLGKALLERRLVACVNIIGKVRSLYCWKGGIEDDAEHLLLMKTRRDRYEALASALDELHPYDVPELIALPIEKGSKDYLGWLDEIVSSDGIEGTT